MQRSSATRKSNSSVSCEITGSHFAYYSNRNKGRKVVTTRFSTVSAVGSVARA
jgi:catabolite regulation protein CreA